MIRKMRKLRLIIHREDREGLLDQLQEAGIVHVVTHKTVKEGPYLVELEKLWAAGKNLAQTGLQWRPHLPPDTWKGSPLELAKKSTELEARFKLLGDQRAEKLRQVEMIRPFGEFDPELLDNLGRRRIRVALCSIARNNYHQLPLTAASVHFLREWSGGIYFAVFTHQQDKITPEIQRLLACETSVPRLSLKVLEREIKNLETELDLINRDRIILTSFEDWLSGEIMKEQDLVLRRISSQALEEAAGGAILVLEGFYPLDQEDKILPRLKDLPIVPLVNEPEVHDQVPVSLKNGPFTRLFEPITRIFSLPNYRELDTTPFFAPFYTLFFGLCLADFGYGVLIFIAAVLGLLMTKKASLRPLLVLGVVFSLSVMFAGIILNDYFGVKIGGEGFPSASVPFLAQLAWFQEQNDAMLLPLLLGILQVLFGLILRVINQVKHLGPQGALQPLGTISLIFGTLALLLPLLGASFTIGPIPVGLWFSFLPPALGPWMMAGGVGLILLFNGLEKGTKVWLRPLTGLWKLYELVTGLPGDILSYLRLFALGLAGGLLAEAVNHIATMMATGGNLWQYLAMTGVLLVGHGLNLGIGLLSAFVHSLRLTFVEFYKAVEFTGGGLEYRPLKKSGVVHPIPPALEPGRPDK